LVGELSPVGFRTDELRICLNSGSPGEFVKDLSLFPGDKAIFGKESLLLAVSESTIVQVEVYGLKMQRSSTSQVISWIPPRRTI